jgi:protein-S-isoprenylcysteine O-methyltransferase Ste14
VGAVLILATKILDFKCLKAFSAAGGTFYYADPPKRMVTTGPYGHVRNPLYLTLFIDTSGLFLAFGSTAFLIILVLEAVGVNYLVVRWEEPGLEQRFGSAYLDYKRNVPRWIPCGRSSGHE